MQCECPTDGFCTRYGREMGGRMRELCRGVNVDIGTAEAFRQQWLREAGAASSIKKDKPPRSLVLITEQAPGDALVMTAAIYSLHRTHPGKFITAVDTPYREVFEHNPDVCTIQEARAAGAKDLRMHYPAIHQSNARGIHFMQGYCEFLQEVLGVPVPLATDRPLLYFSSDAYMPPYPYWLVCSGVKSDLTNKRWGHARYQDVVNLGIVRFVQVGAADHARLAGADDMRGKTTLRQLFDLARSAQGVLCGVSLLMHVAAALGKPCVALAGGREPVAWNAYPTVHYLHTVGMLPCSDLQGGHGGACWRSRVEPLGDSAVLDGSLCELPVREAEAVPRCMTLLTPEMVAEKISQISSARSTTW